MSLNADPDASSPYFEVTVPPDSWVFLTQDAPEKKEWVEAIEQALVSPLYSVAHIEGPLTRGTVLCRAWRRGG